jgi:hypothetical protein
MKHFGKLTYNKFLNDPNIIFRQFSFKDLFYLDTNVLHFNENYKANEGSYFFSVLTNIKNDENIDDKDTKENPLFSAMMGAPETSFTFAKILPQEFKYHMWEPNRQVRQLIWAVNIYNLRISGAESPYEINSVKDWFKEYCDSNIGPERKSFSTVVKKDFFYNSPTLKKDYNELREMYERYSLRKFKQNGKTN